MKNFLINMCAKWGQVVGRFNETISIGTYSFLDNSFQQVFITTEGIKPSIYKTKCSYPRINKSNNGSV